ncbi:hypothetical protein NLX83_28795 [Allokutzneria sp. A3M-2-11 16]|uniref:hypothetical protein n=1 Tax=Allokutzneria sp. A3M-2-11 16 TaxID=2962043 RepID=UPI0020B74BC9|nr:hypothetical protein [Allokutzneria sp. A3M-2-11 16]MCP3803283.1 hypothetical protein [Allokutzneria sp. A3M-2-11 16]
MSADQLTVTARAEDDRWWSPSPARWTWRPATPSPKPSTRPPTALWGLVLIQRRLRVTGLDAELAVTAPAVTAP